MSVIIRNTGSGGGAIGGSSKGFPPGDVTNIQATINTGKVLIKWTDPEDTVLDGVTVAKWKGTKLIRKVGGYPTSSKDGDVVIDSTVKNSYKDTAFIDSGLTNNTTYYYRFYTYSDVGVLNDSSDLVFKATPLDFAPVLSDNTWEQISAASEGNCIPSTWKVGDEITIQLSGSLNESVVLQIWDFNHFDKSDGSGKAGIVFGCKDLLNNEYKMNDNDTNSGGWESCKMRTETMQNIYNSMPSSLKSKIKQVNTVTTKGSTSSALQTSKDHVFIPNWPEVGFSSYGDEGFKFPIFNDNNTRIKKRNGSAGLWWLRSPSRGNDDRFYSVGGGGSANWYDAYLSCGVAFCFCV